MKTNYSSSNDLGKYLYRYIVGGSILLISILICIIVRYKKKQLRGRRINNLNRLPIITHQNNNQMRNNFNRNEIINNSNINKDNENKRKIELLFINILYPIIYSNEFFKGNNTNCTICLENYIDQKSIIIFTPYNHIFHFFFVFKIGH